MDIFSKTKNLVRLPLNKFYFHAQNFGQCSKTLWKLNGWKFIKFDPIEYETGPIYCSIFVQNCWRFLLLFHKTVKQNYLAKIFEVCSLRMWKINSYKFLKAQFSCQTFRAAHVRCVEEKSVYIFFKLLLLLHLCFHRSSPSQMRGFNVAFIIVKFWAVIWQIIVV